MTLKLYLSISRVYYIKLYDWNQAYLLSTYLVHPVQICTSDNPFFSTHLCSSPAPRRSSMINTQSVNAFFQK